jgi:PDZ domain/Aspartyl protease
MKVLAALLTGLASALVACAAGANPLDEVLARSKAAAGGAAIDAIKSTEIHWKVSTGGLDGVATTFEDSVGGRYVDRFEIGPVKGAAGFDGEKSWEQDASGQLRVEDTEDARQAAANEAYRRTYSFWTHRRPGEIEYLREDNESGRKVHVLSVTPTGGRPFELWIDGATYYITRTVEKTAIRTVTVYFSDYSEVGGVKLAHTARVNTGEEKYDSHLTLVEQTFNGVAATVFAMPPPPPRDFGFASGASTSVPFVLANNHIYVDVLLNGRGPYRLLCDTGGANIITPGLAAELGLKPEGQLEGAGVGEKSEDIGIVKVVKTDLGAAYLNNQVFYVFPMQSFAQVEGVPAVGLVGYEVFRRFVVRIDYEGSRLTLLEPSNFKYTGTGTAVQFKFNEHIPQVDGEIDGIAGKFDIDTGSRSSLDLMGPFIEKNGLEEKYQPRVEGVTGWGVGGASRSAVTRASVLKLGGVSIDKPVTELTLQTKGAFTDQYVAGNVGAGVLKRFNLVFDYGNQVIYFEPNANYAKPDVFDRSGLWINSAENGYEIVDVIAGGPAEAAGLKVGDRIRRVDGKATSEVALPALRTRFKSDAPGTKIRIEYERGGQPHDTTLVLKEMV